jgi:glycosyltransferase involved in cell wall biosynthesis
MKILFLLNWMPERGGLAGQVDELIKCLQEDGHEIRIVDTHGSVLKRSWNSIRALWYSFSTDRIFGVGAAFIGFFPLLVAAICSFLTRKKVIHNFHDGQAPAYLAKYGGFVKFIIGRNPIVCASGFVAASFRDKGFNVVEIPYHFDLERSFPKRTIPFEWNKKIIWSRSFFDLYQPELALKAAHLALNKDPLLEFHFYGDGPLFPGLSSKYARPGITFHGFVRRDEFMKEYDRYSIMVNTTCYDNFPLTIVEAGYKKMMVLSTRIGGIATIYDESEILFFDDEKELAVNLLKVISEPAKYDIFRDNLNKRIHEFTWDKVKEPWLSVISNPKKKAG